MGKAEVEVSPIEAHQSARKPLAQCSAAEQSPAVTGRWTGNEEYDDLLSRIFSFLEEQCEEEGDWRVTTHAKGVNVQSRHVAAPVKLVKGQGFIRASPAEVLEMIRNASKRPEWDSMCDYGSIVKTFGPNSDLIYLSYQGKLGVCARDLSLVRAWKEYDDGTVMLVAHSVEDKDVPKVAGKVRAELRDCGYVIRPCGEGSMLCYVIQLDMKGYVPLFFTNLIQTQHPLIISIMRRLLEDGDGGDVDGEHASEMPLHELESHAARSFK
uniref:START domain-containing protein n=1 Tax=Hemiselmis andersenii TaxID=464988 RepID=A0A6U4ZSU2_HEMAN|mmetsp:Transcript_27335/g.63488  ORF Transcript_27335/g.63488 Transcript_27335/m.63488 type:complete len:267 (+) Transcript_27335:78-878(+)